MAFSFTNDTRPLTLGNARMRTGTYTNSTGNDTGGAITTGLNGIFAAGLQPTSGVGGGSADYARSSGTLTVTTTLGESGQWWAIGV